MLCPSTPYVLQFSYDPTAAHPCTQLTKTQYAHNSPPTLPDNADATTRRLLGAFRGISEPMKVLVLGGNGLIGEAIVCALLAAGHDVIGLGREIRKARARLPGVEWMAADMARLLTSATWITVLDRVRPQAIVNCAGALQNGARDDVIAVQSTSLRALYEAAAKIDCKQFVQISATGAGAAARTTFMRSKGVADDALRASSLEWTILRPGLVLSRQAYGGTALLRALAATPFILPVAFPESPIQTVSVDDVADAVVAVLDGKITRHQVYDLVEDQPHPLRAVIHEMRAWLGSPDASVVNVPAAIARILAVVGDGLGWLGWRPPLRTTAVNELAAGIVGNPAPWREASGASLAPLKETLARMPSTIQERWFARTFVLKAMAIASLSLFWIATGCIAISAHAAAANILTDRGLTSAVAKLAVLAGAVMDIVLGCAILVRPWCSRAAQGMILLTAAYLVGGTAIAPDLWADPLGPLLKAVPILVLSLFPLALADDR